MAPSEIADLIARATALLKRAQGLAGAAGETSLNDQLTVLVVTLRDTHAELRRMLSGERVSQLAGPKTSLETAAAKLDILEQRLAP